jgi:hypothetical protein
MVRSYNFFKIFHFLCCWIQMIKLDSHQCIYLWMKLTIVLELVANHSSTFDSTIATIIIRNLQNIVI